MFLKCYCHSSQRNISHFKIASMTVPSVSLWYHRQVTGLGHMFIRRINCRQMSLMAAFMTCPQGCPGFKVPHHPQVLCFLIPTAGTRALTPLLKLPSHGLKISTFCSNPPKTPLCVLSKCPNVECLNFWENTEKSQLMPQKVTRRPFWPSRDLTGRWKTPLLPYQDRFKALKSLLADSI